LIYISNNIRFLPTISKNGPSHSRNDVPDIEAHHSRDEDGSGCILRPFKPFLILGSLVLLAYVLLANVGTQPQGQSRKEPEVIEYSVSEFSLEGQSGRARSVNAVVDYASQFAANSCPYALNNIWRLGPSDCFDFGLTCATFVYSVFEQATSVGSLGGHANTSCTNNSDFFTPIGSNYSDLANMGQAGDIIQSSLGLYGHTAIYVGRGKGAGVPLEYANSVASGKCYRYFQPDPEGEPFIIHSIGDTEYLLDPANNGRPGVCFQKAEQIFGPDAKFTVTGICRLKDQYWP
jgi:hypothetical protein